MMLKIYPDNLARSHSDSSRGIAGRGVAMQATGRDLSKINCYYCNKFAIIRTTAPTSRQLITRIGDADNGTTSSEADINRISRSQADSSSRGKGGKCGAHITRPPPTTTPIAAPRRQMGSTATPTSTKSVLRAFLVYAVRGTSLCEMTPARSPASHSSREGSSLRLSLPKLEWKRKRGPSHSAQSRQQRPRGEELAPDHLLRVLSFSL